MFIWFMRIIALSTLRTFWNNHTLSEQPIKAWVQETRMSSWKNSAELKEKFRNASIINAKRVVFNIKGNNYRLIVDIEYRLQIVFIVWVGIHSEYDKIDVKNISYD